MASQAAVEPCRLGPEILEAAARGWRLLPVGARDKVPLMHEWQIVATSDLSHLEEWAVRFPGCNLGLLTGSTSGVFVLDVDGEDGQKSVLKFAEEGRVLPPTLSVTTGSGIHLYFRWPEGSIIRNSASKLAKGLDIRGEGGQVVIPPSVHRNGNRYAFTDPNARIAKAPLWLLDLLLEKETSNVPSTAAQIDILLEGKRNDGLTRYGGALRRRGASLQELEANLIQANTRRCRPPLPEAEVLRIAASVAKYPVGGPDPLEIAWAAVLKESHSRKYQQFLALCRHLQSSRIGQAIALPLKRIGGLMRCDWTQARRWRRRAVNEGWLCPQERYVAHRRAALFFFNDCLTRVVPLGQSVPLQEPTIGLVGQMWEPSSGTPDEPTEKGYLEGWL